MGSEIWIRDRSSSVAKFMFILSDLIEMIAIMIDVNHFYESQPLLINYRVQIGSKWSVVKLVG